MGHNGWQPSFLTDSIALFILKGPGGVNPEIFSVTRGEKIGYPPVDEPIFLRYKYLN
jgi:hypothetical protein